MQLEPYLIGVGTTRATIVLLTNSYSLSLIIWMQVQRLGVFPMILFKTGHQLETIKDEDESEKPRTNSNTSRRPTLSRVRTASTQSLSKKQRYRQGSRLLSQAGPVDFIRQVHSTVWRPEEGEGFSISGRPGSDGTEDERGEDNRLWR